MTASTSAARRLRELLERPGLVVVPGVTNVLDARAAAQAGFGAVFVTGAGVANSHFGYPDIGLLTLTEMVDVTRRIAAGVDLPVIADGDTGHGNHLNTTRAVREFEHAGAAAIVIEDQVAPKRCGHLDGKAVVGVGEMVEKLVAAGRARQDPDLLIVARTDAIAVEGVAGALERVRRYEDAGADVIFVEAPRTLDELAEVAAAVSLPSIVNMVEGGHTPLLPAEELERMGFKIALYANLALRVASHSVIRAFASLQATGTSAASIDQMLTWEARQQAVGLPAWNELDRAIVEETRRLES